MKKTLSWIISVLLIMVWIAGCASKSSSGNESSSPPAGSSASDGPASESASKPAGEKQTLNVWLISGTTEVQKYVEEFAKQNPDVDAKIAFYASEDYKTQTRLAVDAKQAPDVLVTNAGSTFWEYVDKNAAMDITQIAKDRGWLDRADPKYFETYTREGKLYAVPSGGVTVWQTLYVNKEIFTEFGLQYPKTIDDLITVSKTLRSKGVQPVAFGNKDGWPAILLLGDYFVQKAQFTEIDKINSGEVKWYESAPMKAAMEAVVKLARNEAFMSGYTSSDHVAAIQSWAAGKTAMLYNGSWWPGLTEGTDLGFDKDVFELPLISANDKVQAVQMSADMGMFITPTTKSLDAALRFIDFYTDKGFQKVFSESNNIFSIYPGLNDTLKFDPIFQTKPIMSQFELPKSGIFFDHAFPIPVIEVLKTKLQQAMDGKITVDQALKDIQAKHDEELKK